MAFLDFNWKTPLSRGVILKKTIEKRILHWTVCIFAKTRIRFSNIKFLCRRTSPCMHSVGLRRSQMSNIMWPFLSFLTRSLWYFKVHWAYSLLWRRFCQKWPFLIFLLRVKDIVMRQAMSVKTVEREIEGKDRKKDYFI